MDVENKINDLQNKLENIKEEMRDIKINYLKKDDTNYQKYINKVDNMEDSVSALKANLENISKQTEQNTQIMQSLNLTNTKLTTLLEEYSKTQNEIKIDIKELKGTVNTLNLDTSKNTDMRSFAWDIIKKILIVIGCIIVGMAIEQSSNKSNTSLNSVNQYAEIQIYKEEI